MTLRRIARIWQKIRLRARLAAAMASGYEDCANRSRIKVSYAQCGEDLIAWFLLARLGIERPYYVDVGAHHPTYLSNTALFHLHGARGINVEPDPDLFAAFVRERPHDVNLNVGIAPAEGILDFFRMSNALLNTFSAEEARRIQEERGIGLREKIRLPVVPLDVVVRQAWAPVDFLSVDVEGHDLAVLQTLDLAVCRPAVICVETLDFVSGRKNDAIGRWLEGHDYTSHADTYINTLFLDRRRTPLP